jgi:hypothetical protein
MGDLIPENTVALVVINLREGGAGPGGLLKASNDGTAQMLDLEFTIDGGEFDRRKLWENWVTDGQTEGQQKAAAITRSRVRATLESAHGVNPGDDSRSRHGEAPHQRLGRHRRAEDLREDRRRDRRPEGQDPARQRALARQEQDQGHPDAGGRRLHRARSADRRASRRPAARC